MIGALHVVRMREAQTLDQFDKLLGLPHPDFAVVLYFVLAAFLRSKSE
jgi:hypothetical protein